MAAPNENRLYYADLSNEAVLSIDLDTHTVTNLAGPVQPEGNIDGALDDARFGWIYGLEASSDGERIYVADPANQAVRVVDLSTEQVTSMTHTTWDAPVGLALDEVGGRLFVGDANTGQLWTVTLADGAVAPLGTGELDLPWGMAFTGETLYVVEHGAKGGDEVNIPEAGKNYGWPEISYGVHYSGAKIGQGNAAEGYEQPLHYWDPSIAPGGMVVYRGDEFPDWNGDLLVTALKFKLLVRLDVDPETGNVTGEERLLENRYGRLRDIQIASDGSLLLVTDEDEGRLLRLTRDQD